MALSGTLETFSLPDVLRLLSSTKKTGLLALDGDRGQGRIWVRDGAIVAADADRALNEHIEGVAFELLRFADAEFEFETGAETSTDGSSHDVEDVLAEAELRLAEWREIEAVVPSLDVCVRMVEHIDADRTVTADQWRILAKVGTGADGHALAGQLEQGEYDVCRQLRDLVQDGMVELTDAPAPMRTIDVDAAWESPIESSFVEPALDTDEVTSLGADLASFVAAGTVEEPVAVDATVPDTYEVFADDESEAPDAFETFETFEADTETDTDAEAPSWQTEVETDPIEGSEPVAAEDDDFMSQLSQLSPKAAAAVEATWTDGATSAPEQEPEAADGTEVAASETDEAPAPAASDDVDQNLLLRFLSSAKG